MKEEKRKKKLISFVWMLLFCLFGALASGKEAWAASSVVSLTTGEEEVMKGDTFSVMVTLESADDIGNVELFVVFDSSKVSFLKDGKYTTGGDGLVLISDWNGSAASALKKYTLEFKAKKKGTCKFSIGDQPVVCLANSEEQMSVSSVNMSVEVVTRQTEEEQEKDTQEVTVTEKPTSDKMAELKNILVAEGSLTPEFNKSITAYTITVPNEVTSLSISALAESADTEITIKGNEELIVGENLITITAQNGNGAKKEYRITAFREAKALEAMENGTPGEKPESGVHAMETEDGQVITQYTKVYVKELEDETQIPAGYMKTSIRLDNHTITAYMQENDMSSETYLIYGTDGEGNTGFYEYNRVDYTLRPYEANYGGNTARESAEIVNANFQMMTAIIILILICAALSVALALQLLKKKQQKAKEDDDETELFKDYF